MLCPLRNGEDTDISGKFPFSPMLLIHLNVASYIVLLSLQGPTSTATSLCFCITCTPAAYFTRSSSSFPQNYPQLSSQISFKVLLIRGHKPSGTPGTRHIQSHSHSPQISCSYANFSIGQQANSLGLFH